jgi:hypothetical protein
VDAGALNVAAVGSRSHLAVDDTPFFLISQTRVRGRPSFFGSVTRIRRALSTATNFPRGVLSGYDHLQFTLRGLFEAAGAQDGLEAGNAGQHFSTDPSRDGPLRFRHAGAVIAVAMSYSNDRQSGRLLRVRWEKERDPGVTPKLKRFTGRLKVCQIGHSQFEKSKRNCL